MGTLAIRDPDSTTYVGAIESSEEFGKRIYLEAWKRGWNRAKTKVLRGNGSEWIWTIANLHFPGAIQIVDLFHARHLWDLAQKLYPNQEAEQRRWMMFHQDLLDGGKTEDLVSVLRAIDSSHPELAEKVRVESGYFENNSERMRNPKFRDQDLFVGTGIIEAGCKALIGSRCKQSGMFWTLAAPMRSWRCAAPFQRPVRGLLGGSAGLLTILHHFCVAHPTSRPFPRLASPSRSRPLACGGPLRKRNSR